MTACERDLCLCRRRTLLFYNGWSLCLWQYNGADGDSPLRDRYGRPIVIDADGYGRDPYGYIIDEGGLPRDKYGNIVGEDGIPRNKYGNVVGDDGIPRDKYGNAVDDDGLARDKYGNIIDEGGHPRDKYGNIVDDGGVPRDKYGNAVGTDGHARDKFGNIIDEEGLARDEYGRLVDADGNALPGQESRDEYGNVVVTKNVFITASKTGDAQVPTVLNDLSIIGCTLSLRFCQSSWFSARCPYGCVNHHRSPPTGPTSYQSSSFLE